MRRQIALIAAVFIFNQALANEEHAAAAASATSAASAEATPKAEPKAESIKEAAKPASSSSATASAQTKADLAAIDLREKIAARLKSMRAAKATRDAQAAKLAKIKESTASAAHGTMPASTGPAAAEPHWSYDGEGGPAAWGKLNPNWSKCDLGTRQSPIDIRDGIKVDLEPIKFDYKPGAFSVIDNGHTIQVNVAGGNFINVMGHSYELVQFHFHRPAEERINGKAFEMVAHLVHKDVDGKLAVVAVMIERGKPHSLVQTVWNNLPLEKNDALAVASPLDFIQILPTRREYYTYMGSLTSPPCSEGVLWMVMKEPVQVSADQIAIFSRLYPMNARPLQGASGRMIKESN